MKKFLVASVALFALVGPSLATSVTISWPADPTTRTDGSPLPANQIAGVTVLDNGVAIGTVVGTGLSFTSGQLAPGTHTFTLIVNDTGGLSSAPSSPTPPSITVMVAPPNSINGAILMVQP